MTSRNSHVTAVTSNNIQRDPKNSNLFHDGLLIFLQQVCTLYKKIRVHIPSMHYSLLMLPSNCNIDISGDSIGLVGGGGGGGGARRVLPPNYSMYFWLMLTQSQHVNMCVAILMSFYYAFMRFYEVWYFSLLA